jgi:exonuclease SbcD
VHTSDLHLGIGNYGLIDPATGLSRRIDDFYAAFDHVVDYALEKKADVILLCGDTFKDPNPNPTILKMFATRLGRLSKEGIQTVIIPGNHDAAKGGRAAPPEPLVELKIPNVHYFGKADFSDLTCRSGQTVRVFALPYRHPVKMASEKTKGKTGLDRGLMQEKFREQIAKEIEIFTRAGRKHADTCILVGHLSIQGAIVGSEKAWAVGEEYSVLPSEFDTNLFDYIALGHLHKHQAIKFKVPIVYPGSIERVDLAEAKEAKGFVSVEIKTREAKWKFIEVPTRPMYNFKLDCSDDDPVTTVEQALGSDSITNAIVSIHLTTKESLTPTQKNAIQNLLHDTFWNQIHYAREVTEKKSTKGAFGETLEPHQALDKYLKTLKITENQRQLARKIGQQIIEETTTKGEA